MSVLGPEAAAFVQSQSERTIPLLGKYVTKVPARVISVSGTAPNQKAVVATPDQIAALASGEITEIPRPAMPVYGTVIVDQWVWCLADAAGLHIMGTPGQGTGGTQGPAGVDGKSVLNGSGAPLNTLGSNGDFYVDTQNSRFYGPKAGGAWPTGYISLVGPTGASGLRPGHISGANFEWVSSTSVRITPGEAMVNGTLLSWTSALTLTGISGTANTIRYAYLEAGPALSHSTTAPVYDAALDYWKSGTDATKRCVGFFQLDGSGAVRRFVCMASGRQREWYPVTGEANSNFRVVASGSQTTVWQGFSLGQYVPVHASDWYCSTIINHGATGDNTNVGISPVDLGSALAYTSAWKLRVYAGGSGQAFFPPFWIPTNGSTTSYFRGWNVGSGSFFHLDAMGARFGV